MNLLKPAISTVTEYVPGSTLSKRYKPAELVWRVTLIPVFTLSAVTLAPTTTALLSSVTMPSTRARNVCAQPETANRMNSEMVILDQKLRLMLMTTPLLDPR